MSGPRLRAALRNARALGGLLCVLALLVYANLVELDGTAEQAFRAASFRSEAQVTSALAEHAAEMLRYAVLEYGLLVVAASGLALALVGPALGRALRLVAGTRQA